jgi:aldehyde:ferredoxin oxidoreductase
MSELEILPIRNFQVFRSPEVEKITSKHIRDNYVVRDVFCAGPCPVRCSKFTLVREGMLAGELSEGPEYETIFAFGSCCEVFDLPTIIAADSFSDRYGLDTMSAGVSIAFAMECFEKGLIDTENTEGVELKFGRGELILPLLHKIAYRQGFGDFLAQGTRAMSQKVGRGSEEFAMQVKGLEIGAYDPRGAKGMGAVYAFGPRGGCHHAGGYTAIAEVTSGKFDRFAEEGKANLAIASRNRRSAAHDSGGLCAFVGIGISDDTTALLLSSATGITYSPEDIYTVGERIACVERAFSVREGLMPAEDTLPARLLNEAADKGPNQGQTVDMDVLTREFYAQAQWDPDTGMPRQERVSQLDLGWLLDA